MQAKVGPTRTARIERHRRHPGFRRALALFTGAPLAGASPALVAPQAGAAVADQAAAP
ncbi:hypothetical protein ACOT81_44025 [Streptomyces sp. WI04-05B]|uniref:hypothetical protein n=1 Tax=Streptomyces TaxID=1883 RepID=UPI0029AD7D95|nr:MULTISPECIES: hypothetical protein [unclassified Streptomyces]MDX2548247.1 hypothetical protein [Streptomyces sp. WI04-05B]MDX2586623.1 hypothetical protein [Streptomyces sp. WI04-05A]MDX3746279.1 hypothetical protein [Streptomyces sp. AK08-02]